MWLKGTDGQLATAEGLEPNAHLGCLDSYICHCLETTYEYLELLSKGAKLREVWESKSGFLASRVRYLRPRSPGLLPSPREAEQEHGTGALIRASKHPVSS